MSHQRSSSAPPARQAPPSHWKTQAEYWQTQKRWWSQSSNSAERAGRRALKAPAEAVALAPEAVAPADYGESPQREPPGSRRGHAPTFRDTVVNARIDKGWDRAMRQRPPHERALWSPHSPQLPNSCGRFPGGAAVGTVAVSMDAAARSAWATEGRSVAGHAATAGIATAEAEARRV
eukprot:gene41555-62842_t